MERDTLTTAYSLVTDGTYPVTWSRFIEHEGQTLEEYLKSGGGGGGLPKMKAKVGDVLSVKAVDDEGYPTEYEWVSLKSMLFTADMEQFRTADGEIFYTKE